jgi:hypothetical protein
LKRDHPAHIVEDRRVPRIVDDAGPSDAEFIANAQVEVICRGVLIERERADSGWAGREKNNVTFDGPNVAVPVGTTPALQLVPAFQSPLAGLGSQVAFCACTATAPRQVPAMSSAAALRAARAGPQS